jgi:hypothetical protein
MAKVRVQELDAEDFDLNTDNYEENVFRKAPTNEKSIFARGDKQDKKNAKNYRNSKRSQRREDKESYLNN